MSLNLLKGMMPTLKPLIPQLLTKIEPQIKQALSSKHQKAVAENPEISQTGFFVTVKDGKAMAFDASINEQGQMIKLKNNRSYDLKEALLNLINKV